MILVDTSVWIEYLTKPYSEASQRLDDLFGRQEIVLGDLVMTEVLQGTREGRELRMVEAAIATFRIVTLCGAALAPKAASNYRYLRRRGVTVRGTIDVIIATWCIENRAELLHNDRDFDPIERELGLSVLR